MDISIAPRDLLAAGEAAPFSVLNAHSSVPLLLVCDHASRRLPLALGDLGVAASVLGSHLACDFGAARVTELLAATLQATALLGGYSRLVVDLNRDLRTDDAFLTYSDGVTIFGNRGLSDAQKHARAEALHHPYHAELRRQLQRVSAQRPAALVSVHSFTPIFEGQRRPWEIGILWNEDTATAQLFLGELRARGYVVGDNQPYSGKQLKGYTMSTHAEGSNRPHVLVELRQDLLQQAEWTARVAADLGAIIQQMPALQLGEPGS